MKRRLFQISAALSLLLAAGIVVVWVRSHWYMDEIGLGASKDRAHLRLTMRTLYVSHGDILWLSETLQFHDEAATPNTVNHYFSFNFWETTFAINAQDGYRDPEILAETRQIPTWCGVGYKNAAPFPIAKATADKSESAVVMPIWPILFFLLGAPLLWFGGHLRRRRLLAGGLCTNCGYDLRAHQQGGRCPECGAEIRPAISANSVS